MLDLNQNFGEALMAGGFVPAANESKEGERERKRAWIS